MKLSTVFLILACLLLGLVIASSVRRSGGRKTGKMKNSCGDKSSSRDKSSSGGKSNSGGKSRSGGKSSSGGKNNSGGKSSSGGKSNSGGKSSSGSKSSSGGKGNSESKGKWTTAPTTKLTTVLTSAPTTAPTTEQTTVSTSAPTTTLTIAPTTEQTTVSVSAPTTSPTRAPTTEQTTVITSAPTTTPTTAPTTEQTTVSASAPTAPPTTAPTTEQTTVSSSAPTTTHTSAPTTEQSTVITSAPTTTPTRPPTTEETTVPVTSPTTIDPTVCTAPSASSEGGLPLPRDCWDLLCLYNVSKDGVYQVYPTDGVNISVLCDMATDGGGWTIFQQRHDGSVSFSRKYVDYENGFGDLKTEFWMGNDFLHQFTTIKNQTLRIDFCNKENSAKYAIYDSFAIGSGTECYRLHVADYHGTAHDSLIGSVKDLKNDGQCFSAYDKDQDNLRYDSCASESGWWFNMCSAAYLNSPFRNGVLFWSPRELMRASQMKFRPSHARNVYPMSKPCPINS